MTRYQLLLSAWGLAVVLLLTYCQMPDTADTPTQPLPYLNLHDTVSYVGMETCRSCHQNIYDTFILTGMGQSFDHATPTKSAAKFGKHIAVYDSIANYYYHPFWRADSLFILEYRLLDSDTVHRKEQYVKYIIGSGQHTNSHIYDDNGYLYQAPITFYTQQGVWDLAPGFSGGFNSRFNRIIGLECMTCHNSLPQFVEGSENKYLSVPRGIACERCHGPGEAHVKDKLAGNLVDTAQYTDYTIVNPRNLPRELQMDACRRCHLQGVAVLKPGKQFDDFKPAMPLSSVMDVYLPEYDGNQTQFIMASQAHRLTKSACYQKSEMTCLNCHNPHISVKQTDPSHFNNACLSCHRADATSTNPNSNPSGKQLLTACAIPLPTRIQQNGNDCATCHMPPSPSIDIPHVTVHDHFIRRPIAPANKNAIERFIGLAAVSGGSPDALSKAKGYLHYYESYSSEPAMLDSAGFYLQRAGDNLSRVFEPNIHWRYLRNDYKGIEQYSTKVSLHNIHDAWTAYRIGEAYLQQQKYADAARYLERAVALLPLQGDFSNKLGIAYLQVGNTEAAQKVFEQLLHENPSHVSALTNLGFLCVSAGKLADAEQLYKQSLACDPDYEQALLNMAALKMLQQNRVEAQQYVARLLRKNPQHSKAKQLWQQLIQH